MTDDSTPFPHLFKPIKIGRLELQNRIVMSPVGTRLASNGTVTDAFSEFYATRARGGVGLIILEPCFIEPTDETMFLSLHDDKFISKLQGLVDTIHKSRAKIGIQLFHAGWRAGNKNARFVPPIPPDELPIERIEELVEKFAEAAKRAKTAGFDLIEIHAAHGYLLSQFLSPLGNQRSDEYGGDPVGRTRFVREIIKLIRNEIGTDFPLSCRINGTENVPGGSTIEDTKIIAPLLEKEGLDMLSVSAGALGSYPLTIPPSDTEEACYVGSAEILKTVVHIPLITTGRINNPKIAEEILTSDRADLIAIARGLVADPELPNKASTGQTDRIRKCIACNACLDTDYDGHITCTVNPIAGRETELEISPATQSKKVIIVGGGLAGLEVARVAAMRGHQVSLYEEKDKIGGQWILASKPPHKHGFFGLVDWLSNEIEMLGVEANLNCSVTVSNIDELKPDVVIIATGGIPIVPSVLGFDRPEVVTAWEALQNSPKGERILVIGGGATGLETAEFLTEQGKKVSVVEMLKTFGTDMGGTVYYHLRIRLNKLGIELFKNTEVKEINDSGVVIFRDGKEETWKEFDSFVLALGTKSRNQLTESLKVPEVYVIGDAATPGNAANAMRQGFEIGISM